MRRGERGGREGKGEGGMGKSVGGKWGRRGEVERGGGMVIIITIKTVIIKIIQKICSIYNYNNFKINNYNHFSINIFNTFTINNFKS